jgi:hypothetical protein
MEPNLASITGIMRDVWPVRKAVMEQLGASDLSLFMATIGLKMSEVEMRKFLNPVRDLSPHTNGILDRIENGDVAMLVGKDTYDLISRIRDPIGYWNKMKGMELLVIMVVIMRKNRAIDANPLYKRDGTRTGDEDSYSIVPYTMSRNGSSHSTCDPYMCGNDYHHAFDKEVVDGYKVAMMTSNFRVQTCGKVHIDTDVRVCDETLVYPNMYLSLPISPHRMWTGFINLTTNPFEAVRVDSISELRPRDPGVFGIQFGYPRSVSTYTFMIPYMATDISTNTITAE